MTINLPAEPRDLNFPLNISSSVTYDTPNTPAITDIVPNWPTTDNDELVTVTLKLSLNEYVALASCVDIGSDIAYSDAAVYLWWVWVRSINTMDFCEQVNDCITTNPTTQTAINNTIINSGNVNPNSIDPDNTTGGDRVPDAETESVAPPPPTCDKDALWAGIREMVDRIDQNGRDVLEDLQFINDKIEMWGEIIDLVPLLGDTIKDIGDLFTAQIPDLLNAYNSASSPTFLDNVACDLFEMVCNDCRYPTFDEVFSYFGSLSYFSLPSFTTMTYGGLWDLIKTVSGTVPESLWYSINVWQCFTIGIGGTFKRSYGAKTFEIWASFGEDNPNDNWTLLCDGCGDEWAMEWTGAILANDWYFAQANYGSFVTDKMVAANNPDSKFCFPKIDIPSGEAPVNITAIYADVEGNITRSSSGRGVEFYTDNGFKFKYVFPTATGAFNYNASWAANGVDVNNAIEVRLIVPQNGSNDPSAFGYITRLRIEGNGTIPSWNGTPV